MLKYILRRILMLIPVLLGVAFCVFTLLYFTPGDPARMVLGDLATDEAIKEFRDKEGLNDPFLIQFGNYIYKAVVHGDIGRSYSSKRPVMQEILTAFPYTLKLSAFAMIIAIIIGVHALRNALIPVVTLCGLQFGQLLSGAILTESIFAVPGVGRLMVNAIMSRDYPMVQGGVLFIAITFSIVNLLVEVFLRLSKSPLAMFGLAIIFVLVFCAVFAEVIAP